MSVVEPENNELRWEVVPVEDEDDRFERIDVVDACGSSAVIGIGADCTLVSTPSVSSGIWVFKCNGFGASRLGFCMGKFLDGLGRPRLAKDTDREGTGDE